MSWPSITIDSWDSLVRIAAAVIEGSPVEPTYIFRGQADGTWSLKPSLVRFLPPEISRERALQIEESAANVFTGQAHLHTHNTTSSSLPQTFPAPQPAEWWAVMQHYNAPTRLLDWSQSLFVAAYFAIEQMWDRDGAVFLAHGKTILDAMNQQHGIKKTFLPDDFKNLSSPSQIVIWSPQWKTDRLAAQQGTFTVCLNPLSDHYDWIHEACQQTQANAPEEIFYKKLIIPANQKVRLMAHLRSMNIAAHSLFPGLDGLGRTVGEITRLGSVRHEPTT